MRNILSPNEERARVDALYTRRPIPINLPDNPTLTQKFADRMSELPGDGFTLNPWITYQPYIYNTDALYASAMVRKCNLMRSHTFVAPAQTLYETLVGGSVIAAYATYNTQLAALPGSIILGFNYFEYNYPAATVKAPSNIMIRISDACTGLDLAHDYVGALCYAQYNPYNSNRQAELLMTLPTSPRVIAGSGQINVEIQNTTTSDLACQLMIFVAEPITLVETPGYGSTQGFADR